MVLLASTMLIPGCAAAKETVAQTSDASTPTTTGPTASGTTKPGTTDPRNNKVPIEAPDYNPQAVQPEEEPRLSEAQVREAVSIALGDPRLEDFLKRNDFEVSEVRRTESLHYRPNATDLAHPAARVTIALDDPVSLDQSGYRLGICDFGGATGPFTGMVWIVDLVEKQVAAVSPLWNYKDSCI